MIGISGRELDPLPFEGIRVLDMARVLAGPTVSRLMVEFGADVVKLEAWPNGDVARVLPHLRDGRSGYYIQANRGKRSVCIDFRAERGKELLLELACHADVLVENYRPGVLDSFGLGWDVLHAANPRLILCSVTALGYGGPLSMKPGYDTIGAALSGMAWVSGPCRRAADDAAAAMGDTMTGVHGFAGVAAALFRRERTGLGDWVQVSLLDTYIHSHEINIQQYSGSAVRSNRDQPAPTRRRSRPGGSTAAASATCSWPASPTRTGGGWLRRSIAPSSAPPPLPHQQLRVQHVHELQPLVEAWFASIGEPHAAVERLDAHGVCAEIVYSVAEAVHHPHNVARRAVRTVPDDVWGEVTIPGVPIRFASVPEEPDLRARELGADTRAVLREVLHKDEAAIEELLRAGIVHEPPPGAPGS